MSVLSDLRAQDDPPAQTVNDADRANDEEDDAGQSLDTLVIFQKFYERFDAEERFVEVGRSKGRRRVAVIFWGNAVGEYVWKGETVRVLADRIAVFGQLNQRPERDGEAAKGDRPRRPGEARQGEKDYLESPTFLAEGNVRLEFSDLLVEADTVFFDHDRQRALVLGARGRGRRDSLLRLNGFVNPQELDRLAQNPRDADFDEPEEPPADAIGDPLPSNGDDGDAVRAEPIESSGGDSGAHLAFRAEVIRMLDRDRFEGEEMVISSCEFGVPHFGIGVRSAKIRRETRDGGGDEAPSGGDSGGNQDSDSDVHYDIDPDGTWIQFGETKFVPAPLGRWHTSWEAYNPIRRPLLGHSSKFGTRVGADWKLEWLVAKLPGGESRPVSKFLRTAELDARTEYLSNRGTGYGIAAEYGERPVRWEPWQLSPDTWDYYGSGLYYWIDDRGQDRTALDTEPPVDDERWWGEIRHRQRIPHVGELNVEFSNWSDENFLNEFFPWTRREKEQESVVYFKRSFRDNIGLSAFYKYRPNSFETTTERIPEANVFLAEQPVLDRWVYTSLTGEGVIIRNRPSDTINIPRAIDDPVDDVEARTRRYGRLDAKNEWSVPFGFGRFVRLRPFANIRLSAYEDGLHPDDHSITRHIFGTGVTASQEWSRVLPLRPEDWTRRWFGARALKHSVIPKVTYASLFESNVDHERLFQVDEVDAADNLETLDLSIRNVVWARTGGPRLNPRYAPGRRYASEGEDGESQPGAKLKRIPTTTHQLLDFETSLRWFFQPARDHSNERLSELDLDAVFYPLRYVAVRSRNLLDPNESLGYLLSDNSVTLDVIPDQVVVTAGERIRKSVGAFYYGRFGLRLSRRYRVDTFFGMDPGDRNRTDVEVRVVRFFHRFALDFAYAFDAGEGDNHSFTVNFQPVELLDTQWHRRERKNFRYD